MAMRSTRLTLPGGNVPRPPPPAPRPPVEPPRPAAAKPEPGVPPERIAAHLEAA